MTITNRGPDPAIVTRLEARPPLGTLVVSVAGNSKSFAAVQGRDLFTTGAMARDAGPIPLEFGRPIGPFFNVKILLLTLSMFPFATVSMS